MKVPDLSGAYPLSPDDVRAYRRDGCILLRGVVTREEIGAYRPMFREAWKANKLTDLPIEERDTYGRAFTQALSLGLRDERLFPFAYGLRFARIAAELMGVPRVRMFLDEAFFKEPGSGPTPWHQDQPVWPFDAQQGVTLWIPLMDVTPEMGALTFAAGSHHEGQLVEADISDESDAALGRVVSERRYALITYDDVVVGDITAHNGWMVHRAGENRTELTREVYAMHYFQDGARVLPPDHGERDRILNHFAPELRPGDLAANENWRLVYPHAEPPAAGR